MCLKFKLQCGTCNYCICKLKLHKIGINDKIKRKEKGKKVPLSFLELGLHQGRHNRQV